MNITHFKVNQNEIQRTAPQEARIVAGSAGTNAVQFEFEPTVWAALTATAVFQADDVEKSVLITDKTAAYEIPHEVMASAGACLKVGVFGVDCEGQVIVPTTYAKICDTVLSGANLEAEEAVSETDSIYAQWVATVAEDAAIAAAAAQQASSYVETVEVAAQSLADAVELAEGLESDATAAAQSAIDSIEATAATQMAALQEIGAKAPILSADETWLIWDAESESYQDTEVSASGAAFTYDDFTVEQLAALKGEKGDTGDTGAAGATGAQGAAFTYADFTAEQLAALKGEKGDTGDTGAAGATGAQGAAFTYADFTAEQLAALKGETGDTGDTGAMGATGAQGEPTTVNGLTGESITLTASDITITNYTAVSEVSAISAGDTISQAIAKLEASSTNIASTADGIATYIHAYTYDEDTAVGTHTLTGSGDNGKFEAVAEVSDSDLFVVNATTYTAKTDAANGAAFIVGNWHKFTLDTENLVIYFTSTSVGVANPSDSVAQFRNMVIVAADTTIDSVDVPDGTIIAVLEE